MCFFGMALTRLVPSDPPVSLHTIWSYGRAQRQTKITSSAAASHSENRVLVGL